RITWDIATAASTVKARAGWGFSGTGFELPGSGVASGATSTLLDSSAASTSLIQNSLNSGGQLGRYVFQVRNGQPPNIPPQIAVTNRTLEGNATNSYTGYTGVGDASATDPDGSIVSFTNNLPEVLPLGTTQVTWTAEDNRGAVTSVVQTIVVVDTTPPANPTLTSPTHSTGTWTNANVVTVNSAGATDICTGVNGFSYGWSSGVPATPDSTLDPAIEQQVTVEVPVVVHEETWPDAAWPADWIPSDATYVRLTNAAGRTQGSYAAEVWANNNTRRTVNFYRDYDLSGLTSATLSFWDRLVGSNGTDYVRAEYSTNGGTSYTQLRNATTNATWGQRSFSLPVGGTVRVRFSASVNNAAEYANWDDIIVSGTTMSTTTVLSTSTTTALADGTWFFNLRTVDNAGNWSAPVNLGPFLLDTTAPVTSSNVPSAWSPTPVTVTLTASDAG
ncbi:MAG: hypothetical protein Q8M66_07280, partial [Actinomycetota bacterium]|nr:hypothetical protein [Actinomycetota bacterium]